MDFEVLPVRAADAAGNMAVDFLLLQRHPRPDAVRYRHYDWRRPALTFGYGQKIDFVRARLPAGEEPLDITRRPTGGGMVDHRDDWTYALVLPRGHDLCERPGPMIYRTIHETLAATLNALGASVELQRSQPETEPGLCFERPEMGDVVRRDDGRKVAGAALKRNKRGVLLQGSIWRPLAGIGDWDGLADRFPASLASVLGGSIVERGWPDFDVEEEQALIDQYSAPEWIEAR